MECDSRGTHERNRMPHDVISTCPVCSGRLTREQLTLLESFLRSRGNLRDMERELGISYPTVRSRVEALVRALGFGARADADESEDAVAEPPAEAGRTRE